MPAKVLLVDDEPAVLKSLSRVLRNEGYEILTAGSGPEALEIVAEHKVAVIICDQRMPGMTGAETLAESVKLRPDAIRITLTGYTDLDGAEARINQGGISRFLRKPWDDVNLRTVVREAVGQYEMKQEAHRLHEVTRKRRDELQERYQTLEQKALERTGTVGEKILAVDKDAETVRLLSLRLKAEKYELITASDALQGVRCYLDHKPDLIIANSRLPGGGASAIHRQLHSHSDFTTPIICLADTAEPELQEEASALGAAAFHIKPIDMDELLVEAHRILQGPAEAAESLARGKPRKS